MGRPRYLRWLAAAIVLCVGLYAEFRPTHTTEHPFAAAPVAEGDAIIAVDWREVPAGLLVPPDLADAHAAVAVAKGEPLLPSHVAAAGQVPAGWWSIPVPMPFTAPTGTLVQLVDSVTQSTTEGVIVAQPPDDPFAVAPTALVAVPAQAAAAMAVAASEGRVTVLITDG